MAAIEAQCASPASALDSSGDLLGDDDLQQLLEWQRSGRGLPSHGEWKTVRRRTASTSSSCSRDSESEESRKERRKRKWKKSRRVHFSEAPAVKVYSVWDAADGTDFSKPKPRQRRHKKTDKRAAQISKARDFVRNERHPRAGAARLRQQATTEEVKLTEDGKEAASHIKAAQEKVKTAAAQLKRSWRPSDRTLALTSVAILLLVFSFQMIVSRHSGVGQGLQVPPSRVANAGDMPAGNEAEEGGEVEQKMSAWERREERQAKRRARVLAGDPLSAVVGSGESTDTGPARTKQQARSAEVRPPRKSRSKKGKGVKDSKRVKQVEESEEVGIGSLAEASPAAASPARGASVKGMGSSWGRSEKDRQSKGSTGKAKATKPKKKKKRSKDKQKKKRKANKRSKKKQKLAKEEPDTPSSDSTFGLSITSPARNSAVNIDDAVLQMQVGKLPEDTSMALLVNSKFHALPDNYNGEAIRLTGLKPGKVKLDVMVLKGRPAKPTAHLISHVATKFTVYSR